ncbi:hypothetical protein UPYG_G00338080 [Umbra pygmaea]|uniref:Integrator complex subunit 3 n=1 Tax=Umbra pygmaea TaxID=75934 RepID=A0ABD0VX08_UMBPY
MEPSPAKGKPLGRLLVSSTLDAKDELEERFERCVGVVTSLTNGMSERESNDALTANVCKGPQQHEEVCLGLFALLLTEPTQAQRCYRDLTLMNRDGMNVILIKINQILMEKFLKLQDVCRTQLVWMVRELVKSGVIGADGVLMTLMKQIAGGDISSKNLWLAENVLDILVEQREWVLKSGMLIAMSVYTYLRLIVDHGTPTLLVLRQKEVDFCIGMLREKFMECFIIGRDLVRLLQIVARIPEMELLWKDLLHNPQALSPQFTASNAKLALFYDWLFFSPEKDSIMNIEPAILVMHHSMKPHPAITATLLDFMCRIIPHFFPPLEGQVRQGVFNSLTFIMEKRVLAHLAPLFDNPKLDRELRSMLRERFPEFCSSPSPPTEGREESANEMKMEESVSLEMDNHVLLDKEDGCYDNTEAAFSDDEEEMNNKGEGNKKREFRFHPIKEAIIEEPADITPYVDQLDDTMKEKVLQLQKGSDTETQCEVMQEIVDLILEEDFDSEQMSTLASCLAELFKGHFRGDVLPDEITEESLEESVCKPVCLVFRNLCQMQEDNSGFSVLLEMLAELYQKQPKIGYHLLYYLKASKAAMGKMSLYELFAQATALGDLHTCLMMDMKACQEDDVRLLCYLTPSIYTEFPDETLRSGELLNMIVAVIDSTQLQELMCHVMMGDLVMFRKDSVLNILIQSLDWETFEQYSTWQLFLAHNIPLETIIPILQHLKYKEHPEALSCLLLQLRREKPSEEMVKMVLSRPCHPEDQFTTSILRHWAAKHDDVLGEHIKALLIKNNNLPRKRQRAFRKSNTDLLSSLRSSSSKLAQLTLEQILEHMDNLRLNLSNTKNSFFTQTPILQALQHVQASCDEAHKMRFSDLFSLAEEYEEASSKLPKSRRKAPASSPRSRKSAATPVSNEEESASSSASEEEDSKPKAPKRKRKGSSAVGSDSD